MWAFCSAVFFSFCHVSLSEKLEFVEHASPKLPLIFLCIAKNRTDVSDGCFIFGSHILNDSEFPARQTSPSAPTVAFIHKLDPSEVDLTETTA